MYFSNVEKPDGMWVARAEDYPYAKERENLWKTIGGIYKDNPGQFKSEEEIFRIFAEAYFTGSISKIIKLSKLIEKMWGKGSFRKLGEKTKGKKYSPSENK